MCALTGQYFSATLDGNRVLLIPGSTTTAYSRPFARCTVITVTASTAALGPLPFDPYYAATKHAVAGFVRSVGPVFAARGQRVNALCPGGIDTNIVPDPLRASMPASTFRPAGDVARALIAVSETSGSGGLYTLTDDDAFITDAERAALVASQARANAADSRDLVQRLWLELTQLLAERDRAVAAIQADGRTIAAQRGDIDRLSADRAAAIDRAVGEHLGGSTSARRSSGRR